MVCLVPCTCEQHLDWHPFTQEQAVCLESKAGSPLRYLFFAMHEARSRFADHLCSSIFDTYLSAGFRQLS